MKQLARRGVLISAVAALGYGAWRLLQSRAPRADGVRYEAQPFPLPPRPVVVADEAAVDPDAAGNCPVSHPIKGKLGSGIYHRPGASAYERTRADRCYQDETAAERDGLRAAKR